MKSFIAKIAVVCLSLVVFLTGAGVTLINFCCDNCVGQFISGQRACSQHTAVVTPVHSCCSNADQAIAMENQCAEASDNHSADDCCKVQRMSIDLDSFHHSTLQNVSNSYTWVACVLFYAGEYWLLENSLSDINHRIKAPPKLFSPRDYLSFIRILRI